MSRVGSGTALLGAHVSIAGGFEQAIRRGEELGASAIQVFTKSSNQWRARPLPDDEIRAWREAWKASGVLSITAHASYLINLASPDGALWTKSVGSLQEELERCEILGIPHLVVHPGSFKDSTLEAGIQRISSALDEVHARTRGIGAKVLLETMAGQGNSVGRRFEELAAILGGVPEAERVGVCLDSCHVFAAGYRLDGEESLGKTLDEFDTAVGLDRLLAVHLNDSVFPAASQRDRHAAIGEGAIGRDALGAFVRSARLAGLPMLLETPIEGHAKDLDTLRELRGSRGGEIGD